MPVDKIDCEAEHYDVHRQFYGNRWPKFQKLAQKKKVWFLPIVLVTIRLVVTHHFSYVQRIRAPFFAANDFFRVPVSKLLPIQLYEQFAGGTSNREL